MQNKYLTFRKSNGASRNDIARATGITPRTITTLRMGVSIRPLIRCLKWLITTVYR